MSDINAIFVNQVGYKPNAGKFAYVAVERLPGYAKNFSEGKGMTFSVRDKNGNSVFNGSLADDVKDNLTLEFICRADFSSLNADGEYYITLDAFDESVCRSCNFKISDSVYDDLMYDALHYFYLSRCGVKIESKTDDGLWNHEPCHTSPAVVYGDEEKTKLVTGGWHDAGDYGRYVIAVTKAAMDLMLASQNLKTRLDDSDRNSEEGLNGSADMSYERQIIASIKDEVHFATDWLLQMQREDGAVYHKITCYHFCGFVMPEDEKDVQVLAPVSTAATADFAGCLAYASVFFKDEMPEYSEKLLNAARNAQVYLDTHEDEIYKNPPEITTGNYGDLNVKDERFFALSALFYATGRKEFLMNAVKIRNEAANTPVDKENPWKNAWYIGFGWGIVNGYGLEILLCCYEKNLYGIRKMLSESDYKNLFDDVLKKADGNLKVSKSASFATCVKMLGWGSNGQVCDEAHILMLAFKLTKNEEYRKAAFSQIDYVLGCNSMNICYVSRHGTFSPEHLHHRSSGAKGISMPGMLAGGPCQGLHDKAAADCLKEQPPMRCYLDSQDSYSTNEIDIYWNSPFVYMMSYMI